MAKQGILDRLKDGPVLGDGGYLLELEKRGWVKAGPFTPEVVLLRPDAVRDLHVEFREAGADVLQALTFYASRDKLATVGLDGRLADLNRAAVRIAREAAGDRCLVAGNVSLTWMYEADSPAAADRVRATFDEQLALQVEEGVDFVIGETYSALGEALLAVECGKRTGLPLMEQVRKAVSGPIACQPVGYRTPADSPDFTSLPEFPFELDRLQLTRKEMAAFALQARDLGVQYIGSCCGSVASHVREMARALGKQAADSRPWRVDYAKPMSAYEYYRHEGT
jgi:betaine-homocysteine S-methyltransferase